MFLVYCRDMKKGTKDKRSRKEETSGLEPDKAVVRYLSKYIANMTFHNFVNQKYLADLVFVNLLDISSLKN